MARTSDYNGLIYNAVIIPCISTDIIQHFQNRFIIVSKQLKTLTFAYYVVSSKTGTIHGDCHGMNCHKYEYLCLKKLCSDK